jgi:DNA-binding NarL/FixJ family response regulator
MEILLVDDHAIFREGLKGILAEEFEGALFGEAGKATEALERISYRKSELAEIEEFQASKAARAGDFYLDKSGFFLMPTQGEM